MSFLFGNPLTPQVKVATPPIVATTPPPTSGPQAQQYPIGTFWIDQSTNIVYTLTSFANGIATWVNQVSGGGTFSSLTVDPGPTAITGEFRVNGNVDEGAVIRLQENGGSAGTIVIQSLQGTSDSSIDITSALGGVTVQAAGAGNGATFESTAGPVFIQSGANAAPSLTLQSTGGTSNTMRIKNTNGTNDAGTISAASISMISTSGGIGIQAGKDISTSSTTTTSIQSVTGTTISAGGVLTAQSSDTTGSDVVIQALGGAGAGIKIDPETVLSIAPTATVTTIGVGNVTPTVNRTTTVNGGVVNAAHTDTLNLATGGVSTSASAVKTVNIATGDNLLGITNINIGTGDAASGTQDINIGTGTGGGTKTIAMGNVDGLTAINAFGDISMNTSTSNGDTIIGNKTAGGVVQIYSLTNIDIDPVATLTLAPTATVTAIDIGNISPTVNRTTTLNGGAVVSAHTDTLDLATGGVNTNAGASKVVNIATGDNLLGSQTVNISTGTALTGAKTVTIGNVDGLTTINEFGVVDINVSGPGATTIGNTATGGNVLVASAGTITVNSADTVTGAVVIEATGAGGGISIAPTATTLQVDIGNVVPTVSRTTNIGVGTVATAVTDTLNIGTGATSTNAGANKILNIATGANSLGITTVNVATGTTTTGTKTVNIGNADALTAINALGVVHINTSGTGATTIGSATGGTIIAQSNTASATAIQLNASAAAGGITATVGSNNFNVSGGNLAIATAAKGISFQSGCTIVSGAGSPDTLVTAAKGSLYLRTDGSGVNDRMYVNTNGGTAWTAVVTVS